jgi:hypothetical protein
MQANEGERADMVTLYKQCCVRNWGALVTKVRSLSLQRADRLEGATMWYTKYFGRVPPSIQQLW